jgi:uncharacterized membrane protein
MFIWYVGLRWSSLGNELGKITNGAFKLNWWFAPINFVTAILSVVFLTIALRDFDYALKIRWLSWIAAFLCARNIWYILEDVIDYYNYPSQKQMIFILIDVAMVINTMIWLHIFRSVN